MVDKVEIVDYDASDIAPPFKSTKWKDYPVYYDDVLHLYFIVKNEIRFPLLSVTTFIGMFEEEFNEQEMALRCALKDSYKCNCLDTSDWESIDAESRVKRIIKAWHKNNKEATDYGSAAHAACEWYVKHPETSPEEIYTHIKYMYGKKAARPVILSFVYELKNFLDEYSKWEWIAEPVLTNPEWGLAGQSDLVLKSKNSKEKCGGDAKNSKEFCIIDYKTNKVKPGTEKAFCNMKGVFSDFPDTNYYHYLIQLCLYANMLLKEHPDYTIKELIILWLNPDTGKIEPVYLDVKMVSVIAKIMENLKQQRVFLESYKSI